MKRTHIWVGSNALLVGHLGRVQIQATGHATVQHRLTATGLTTMLVWEQRRNGDDAGLWLVLHDAVLDGVLELPGAGAKIGLGEERVTQVAKTKTTQNSVGQGHSVGFTAIDGHATVVVEPLIGQQGQWAWRDGVGDHTLPFGQLDDLLAEAEEPVVEELDECSLIGHPQAVQGLDAGQLFRDVRTAVVPRLLTANRVSRFVQRSAAAKKEIKQK